MQADLRLNGWKSLIYSAFLGPFYLSLYLWESRRFNPAAGYWAWLPLPLLLVCAYLSLALSFNPNWVRLVYLFIFLVMYGIAFLSNWIIVSKSKTGKPRPRSGLLFSRAMAWMLFMIVVFFGLSTIVQALCFWILGEYITVYFSSAGNLIGLWLLVGPLFGFVYGLQGKNDYMNRDIRGLLKSSLLIFLFIAIQTVLVLFLVVYPVQRLASLAYTPQLPDFFFYFLLAFSIPLAIMHLMPRAALYPLKKGLTILIAAIPLIMLHAVVLSSYTVTVNLTVASILEDKHRLSSAKALYARTIPYIRHDHLLATLNHRQGVLSVLNKRYGIAISHFKKVIADYSENYDVYRKASKYVKSFERHRRAGKMDRKILSVRHRTFEQAASCFPNSLSVILSFYEEEPISTRKLSYAIKEGFSEGTFIWKAASVLDQNGYSLVTTFWQNKNTIIKLLQADYPVLIYIPGHVYTLYGYDSRMEMFLTYDTAKLNRWDDNPFSEFQRTWMQGNFLMSVVVKKGAEARLNVLAPQMFRYSQAHQWWQKSQISRYYESKKNYWIDYDPDKLSALLGLDGLKLNDPVLHESGFDPFPWDPQKWKREIMPVLRNPSATQWPVFERNIVYLLYHRKFDKARDLIQLYQSHLTGRYNPYLSRFLELKLATAVAAENESEILSLSDKLIGITGRQKFGSYWGHYYKARILMKRGHAPEAARLLLPLLNNLKLTLNIPQKAFAPILELLDKIILKDPSLIDREKLPLLKVARVYYGMEG